VSIAYREANLRARIKAAGGIWRSPPRTCEIHWESVRQLGLDGMVVERK